MTTYNFSITGNTNEVDYIAGSNSARINAAEQLSVPVPSPPSSVVELNYTPSSITFMLNGKKTTVKNPDPTLSLLDFLRYHTNLTGTRKFCNQGGCGVCIVMLSFKDQQDGLLRNVSINSCLKRLVQCHGCAITTTEGIGSSKVGFHAVQSRISLNQGLQCGACTPGQVMSIYSALQPNTYTQQITSSGMVEKLLDGNLCRCSCYYGIIKTAKSFAPDKSSDVSFTHNISYNPNSDVNASLYSTFLKDSLEKTLMFKSSDFDVTYVVPKTVSELPSLVSSYQMKDIEFVNGNTGTGVYGKEYHKLYIDITYLTDLHKVAETSTSMVFGANVPYNKIVSKLNATTDQKLLAISEHIYHIAGQSVRNSGGLGGALALTKYKKLISDSMSCLMANNSTINVMKVSKTAVSSLVSMTLDEYLTYNNSEEKLLIVDVTIPKSVTGEHFNSFRIAKRQVNAVSFINAAFRYVLAAGVVQSCDIVYGAVKNNGFPVRASTASAYLVGKQLTQSVFNTTLTHLSTDIVMEVQDDYKSLSKANGLTAERQQLVNILFYKSMLKLQNSLGVMDVSNSSALSVWNDGVSADYERVFEVDPSFNFLHQPNIKSDSYTIASGESKYTDDIPVVGNTLFGKIVFAEHSSGSVDANSPVTLNAVTKARNTEGVELVFTCWEHELNWDDAGNIFPGFNIHAGTSIHSAGTVVALIFATSQDLADKVASEMKFAYKDVSSDNKSTEYMINNKIFAVPSSVKKLGNGAVELSAYQNVSNIDASATGILVSDLSAQGGFNAANVLHFYLENTCVSIDRNPIDGKYLIYCSAQALGIVKAAIAKFNLLDSQFTLKTLRLGGGFGGKFATPLFVTYFALMGAVNTNSNIRFLLPLEDETRLLNGRAQGVINQKVGFSNNGKINSLRRQSYRNIEDNKWDGEGRVFPFDISNVYDGRDMVDGRVGMCTAWRGAGRPEKNLIKTLPIDIVAGSLNKKFDEIMSLNLIEDVSVEASYNENGWTALNKDVNIFRTLVTKLHTDSKYNYAARQAAIDTFNANNRWKKRALVTCPIADEVGTWMGDFFYGSKESMAVVQFNSSEHIGYQVESANLVPDDSYKVKLSVEVCEMGQGSHIMCQQMFAEMMDCPLELIQIEQGDSSLFPAGNGFGGGSQGTMTQVDSVRRLALQMRHRWGELDGSNNPVKYGGLTAKDVFKLEDSSWVTINDISDGLASSGLEGYLLVDESGVPILDGSNQQIDTVATASAELIFTASFNALTELERLTKTWKLRVKSNVNELSGKVNRVLANQTINAKNDIEDYKVISCRMAEVEVDCLTGHTKVIEINALDEYGKSWNPAIAAGQTEGGSIMAASVILMESREYDNENMPLNLDTWTYKIASSFDVPEKMTTELHDFHNAFPNDDFPQKPSTEMGVFTMMPIYFAIKEAIRAFRSQHGKSTNFDLNIPASPTEVLKVLELENSDLLL